MYRTPVLRQIAKTLPHVKDILLKASVAQREFLALGQEEADRIFAAVSREACKHRLPLAKLAATETGIGCFEDKVIKNGLIAELMYDRYKDMKTCGLIHHDVVHGMSSYAFPAGPVAAITPVTNPTSTAIAKSLMMAKTRNAGIFLPHPTASDCTAETVRICREAGEAAGAPQDWIQTVEKPTMEISRSVMTADEIRLILATGGPGVVHASYTSGKPALGVGGGNAPVLVDELADLQVACGSIISGKTFDNGLICAAEQSLVVVDEVYDEFKNLLIQRGAHFIDDHDRSKLQDFIHRDGHINPAIVGQTAQVIAQRAGFASSFPGDAVVMATEETEIGPANALSAEKMSPVLSIFRAKDFDHAVDMCAQLAAYGGIGHTGGIYTEVLGFTSARVVEYVNRVPVGRVIVNAPTSLTVIGSAFNFNVEPSLSLGVGTQAGSSISSNVTPMNLVNTTTVAERQNHLEWFNLPSRLFFNRGCLEEALGQCAKPDGSGNRTTRAIVITDPGMHACGHVDRLSNALIGLGYEVEVFSDVTPDPDMECVRKGVTVCERFKPDIMFCLGGGSPIDAGKFIRVQYEHPDFTLTEAATRFVELRKRTNPFPRSGSKIKQLVAIPTTSGTGSEVSPFTVITDDTGIKYPIASYALTPDIAICDSTFCDGLPKPLIAVAGIDAVTHAIESYVSVVQHDFTREHSIEALQLLFEHLPESYEKGTPRARDGVHRGATLAGIAFSNSFLGVCHSIAHRVGGAFHLPHGLTNSILLPFVIRYNACDSPTRMGLYPNYTHPEAKERYARLAEAIDADEASCEGLIRALQKLARTLDLPMTFHEAGIPESQYMAALDSMAEGAFDDQCTLANPRFPLIPEIKEILIDAYYGEQQETHQHHESDPEEEKAA